MPTRTTPGDLGLPRLGNSPQLVKTANIDVAKTTSRRFMESYCRNVWKLSAGEQPGGVKGTA
jgi:hypothetical protein